MLSWWRTVSFLLMLSSGGSGFIRPSKFTSQLVHHFAGVEDERAVAAEA
jgi:hypothetical protein